MSGLWWRRSRWTSARGQRGSRRWCAKAMRTDPFCGVVYVFRAKRADRVKLIFWDGSGVVLVAKRLEQGQFRWPAVRDGVMRLSAAQLQALARRARLAAGARAAAHHGAERSRAEPESRPRPAVKTVANGSPDMIHSRYDEHRRNPPRRPRPVEGDAAGRAGGKRAVAPDHQGIAAVSLWTAGREPARGAAAARAGGGRAGRSRRRRRERGESPGRENGACRPAPGEPRCLAGPSAADRNGRRYRQHDLPRLLAARCIGSARMSPNGSTSCRRSSGCWSCAGPNTPAGPAKTWWCRRRPRRG